jgi:hypothetical protein
MATAANRPGERPSGLWLLPRKDACNTGRADAPASLQGAPAEVWRCGAEAGATVFVQRVGENYLAQVGRGLRLVTPEGKPLWSRPALGVGVVVDVGDLNGHGPDEALVSLGKKGFARIRLSDGKTLWEWTSPPGTYLVRYQLLRQDCGVRLVVFPPFSTLGMCFDFAGTRDAPDLLWQHDYAGVYASGYGPGVVLADMDNDGQPEVVIASKRVGVEQSAYLAVIDLDTGEIRTDVSYEIKDGPNVGRPYGLLQAVDLDGDGFRDVVLMMSQVEEYVAVIRNEGGKELQPVWSQFFEKDFPADLVEFRPTTTSVADVNGDGRPELVFGLYNATGDERWHTLVLDPMVGLDTPLANLPDRYCWGTEDLDGDGTPEVVTGPTRARNYTSANKLHVVSGQGFQDIATLDNAQLVRTEVNLYMPARPVANDLVYYGALQSPVCAGGGLLVRQEGRDAVWRVADGESVLSPPPPPVEAPRTDGGLAASCPLVTVADGRRELVIALSDGTVQGGVPDWQRRGGFASSWRVSGTMPAAWLDPGGRRVLCTVATDADEIELHTPGGHRPAVRVQLPAPVNRNLSFSDAWPRASAWPVPFGANDLRVYVGLRLNEHALGGALCDASGNVLWADLERGPHPRAAAVADLDGDGEAEIVVDNHGMQYVYDASGSPRMVAHVWGDSIPGRGDGCAHALPIVGPFAEGGGTGIFMSPGYTAMELTDGNGERLAQRDLENHFEFACRVAAVAQPRGPGLWDAGVVSEKGTFHCIDLATLETRWTVDLDAGTLWPVSVVAGDLTGSGVDGFLVGLPNGELVAICEAAGQGAVLWETRLDAPINEAILADVDGDGLCEIILSADDGTVRVLK